MNKLYILLVVIFLNTAVMADIYFDDGGYHLINDNTYANEHIYLDWRTPNDPGTRVEMISGKIDDIQLYNKSSFTFNGGIITKSIRTNGNCTVTMNGGSLGWDFHAYGSDVINITGGLVGDDLFSRGNSTVTLSGGLVGTNIVALDNGIMYIDGTNFKIGGNTLSTGDSLRNYGVPGGTQNTYLTGVITGTLKDGSSINNTFYILDKTEADIIIIPEPATMILLSLCSLALMKRKTL